MNLIIKQPTTSIEILNSHNVVEALYQLTKPDPMSGLPSVDAVLVGRIQVPSAYEDAVNFLNTQFSADNSDNGSDFQVLVWGDNYYIRFADPEVESVIRNALGKEQDEGVLSSELSSFQPNFNGNTVIEYFDEMKYCSPMVRDNAFSNCTNLKSIDLTNVTSMRGNGFYFRGCINLEYFHGINSEKGVLNLANLNTADFNSWFFNCKKLERITSLGFISGIGNWAFSGCSALESVTGISAVTSIRSNAFEGCTSLATITLQNITRIDASAFNACSSLEYCDGLNSTQGELNLPNLTGTLGGSAFKGCVKLTSVASLGSITSIGDNAFENCTNLATINIPSTVTSVGTNVFNGCTNLVITDLNLPNLTSLSTSSFAHTKIQTISDLGNIITIPNYCFAVSTLTSIVIPNSVTSIGNNAFDSCSGLTSITIPNSVTNIGSSAFEDCSGLSSLTIPNSVTSISHRAFRDCSGLTSVTIGNGVTTIGNFVFQDCKVMTSITIGNSVTYIGDDAFRNCVSLTSITITATTPPMLSGNPFSNTNDCPIYVPSGSVSAYQTAANWGMYTDRIQAIPTT